MVAPKFQNTQTPLYQYHHNTAPITAVTIIIIIIALSYSYVFTSFPVSVSSICLDISSRILLSHICQFHSSLPVLLSKHCAQYQYRSRLWTLCHGLHCLSLSGERYTHTADIQITTSAESASELDGRNKEGERERERDREKEAANKQRHSWGSYQ